MATRQNERIQRIKEYCARHYQHKTDSELDFSNFVVLEDKKLIYCSNPKVACSTWKRILATAQGMNVTAVHGIHLYTRGKFKLLSQLSLEERKEKLATYTKFFFVREPYERLLSAYRDCFYGSYKRKQEYWQNYGRFIQETIERAGIRNKSEGGETTFSEFIAYLDHRRKNGGKFQEHWRAQNELCHPCHIQYDIVGHYGTFFEDTKYIYSRVKFDDRVQLPRWHPSSTGPLLLKFYSKLPDKRVLQVTNLYQPDFELFGYWYPSASQKHGEH